MLTLRNPRSGLGAAAVVAAALGSLMFNGISPAAADTNPTAVPSASPPVKVDPTSPGLKLADGATLAPSRVLDIKSIIVDEGGEERRSETNQDISFALQAEVLFGKDSADLSPTATARIQAIADEVKKQKATNVRVFGFTDNLGSHEHGVELSKQRANAVQGVLSQQLGAGVTFEIRGYAEQYPIADNSTEEGRKKNRRVEVTFPRGQ
ncbi:MULTISPECIES: OmpA family protein [unclassified Streptomyces]|uniref:OmpA family protein n=1 Tax=unclassified Streptomyces TaxID=2593676 RepID=UPI001E071854|nr:OmpA family protein [Streptomyces sp. MAG02]